MLQGYLKLLPQRLKPVGGWQAIAGLKACATQNTAKPEPLPPKTLKA